MSVYDAVGRPLILLPNQATVFHQHQQGSAGTPLAVVSPTVFYQQDSVDTPLAVVSPGNSDLISPANTSFEDEHISSPRDRDGVLPRDRDGGVMIMRYPPSLPASAVVRSYHQQRLNVSHSGDSLVSLPLFFSLLVVFWFDCLVNSLFQLV